MTPNSLSSLHDSRERSHAPVGWNVSGICEPLRLPKVGRLSQERMDTLIQTSDILNYFSNIILANWKAFETPISSIWKFGWES
jgi:hypothetical protein